MEKLQSNVLKSYSRTAGSRRLQVHIETKLPLFLLREKVVLKSELKEVHKVDDIVLEECGTDVPPNHVDQNHFLDVDFPLTEVA